jgi:hypothetical protein
MEVSDYSVVLKIQPYTPEEWAAISAQRNGMLDSMRVIQQAIERKIVCEYFGVNSIHALEQGGNENDAE